MCMMVKVGKIRIAFIFNDWDRVTYLLIGLFSNHKKLMCSFLGDFFICIAR